MSQFPAASANARHRFVPNALNRRTVVAGSATAATAIGLAVAGAGHLLTVRGAGAQSATGAGATAEAATPATGAATACIALAAELTEGPYYLEDALVRGNVIEDREGLPLDLTIGVIDTETCAPLINAAVEIWHCDTRGYYSGVSGNNPGSDSSTDERAAATNATWLRGVQITDANGQVTFQTIFPGWYVSRAIHIHMKVHVDGDVDSANTYEGGHVSHTGQLFFAKNITEKVMATDHYANRPDQERTLNEEDNILGDHVDDPEFMVAMTQLDGSDLGKGYNGTVTVGVDPTAVQTGGSGADGPGGPAGPGAPGSGGVDATQMSKA